MYKMPVLKVNCEAIHKHSKHNYHALKGSRECGCFYCLEIFAPENIQRWIDVKSEEGATAVCPYCAIDALLPEDYTYSITKDLLALMHNVWFGDRGKAI